MTELLNLLFSDAVVKVLLFSASFLAAFILVLSLLPDEGQAKARERLGVTDLQPRPNQVAVLRWFRPFYTMLVPRIASRNIFDTRRAKLHRDLITANLRDEVTPDEFIGFKFVMAVVIPLLVGYLSGALGRPIPIFLWPAVIVGGFLFPDFWLKERIKIRRRSILRALPYTLDLLTLSVEAGLDFIAAIQRLTQRSKSNALLTEFNHMLKEIRLGTARSDALRSMSDRLQIEEISSFTTLLIQADQLGASIGQVLRAQSDQLRASRFQGAEATGARASQLVLFPLVLCIFPAIFIVVLGPTLIGLLQRGLF
ncbi:MAG TPA: type II secretion system F family protein [Bdellovibrionota bacterium]|nr:type II secretion system F family protein [Bdellovibrionota bacterium]